MSKKPNTIQIERFDKKTGETTSKSYAMVHERVKAMREAKNHGMYGIETEIIESLTDIEKRIVIKAVIKDVEGRIHATGYAEEKRTDNSFINMASAIENAETSAIGRALAFLGYLPEGAIASEEEKANNLAVLLEQTLHGLENGEDKKKAIVFANKMIKEAGFNPDQIAILTKAVSKAKVANTKTS